MNMHDANHVKAIVQSMLSLQGQPRFGIVSTGPNPADATCRVKIMPDMDDTGSSSPSAYETGWLPIACISAGPLSVIALPSVGDQVLVLPDSGDAEHGIVVAGCHSTRQLPPISPATGKPAQPGEYLVFVGGVYFHIAGGKIYMGGGDVVVNGNIAATGDITAGFGTADQVNLQTLTVQDVQTGTGTSGEPTPG